MTRAKTDCFAYNPGQYKPRRQKAECTAPDKLYCRDGECRFYKERQSAAGYPETECGNIQNMSIPQQNVAPYIKSEYGTPKPGAAALILAQGEQIRRVTAEEYLKDKIGSDADDRRANEEDT